MTWQFSRELLDALLIIGALQGCVLCVPLLRYRNNRIPNRILVALIALLAADLLFAYVNNSPLAARYPALYDLNASFPFLFTPLMYFYVGAMTGKITRFRARYLAHAAPFVAHAAFSWFAFYRLDDGAKRALILAAAEAGRFVDRRMFLIPLGGGRPSGAQLAGVAAILAVASAYIAAMARRIARYRRELREFYSDLRNKVSGLLTFTLVATISIWVLVAFVIATGIKNQVIPMIAYTIAIYVGTYILMTVPEVFSANREMNALLGPAGETAADDERTADQDGVIRRLTDYLKSSKSYLNPELTIGDIGDSIDVPVHQLSKAINRRLGKNFYQFVNEYRVGEAMRLLGDERLADRSVLAIGMDAGFSSKSTFNDAFKKITGQTPTHYRTRGKNASE